MTGRQARGLWSWPVLRVFYPPQATEPVYFFIPITTCNMWHVRWINTTCVTACKLWHAEQVNKHYCNMCHVGQMNKHCYNAITLVTGFMLDWWININITLVMCHVGQVNKHYQDLKQPQPAAQNDTRTSMSPSPAPSSSSTSSAS